MERTFNVRDWGRTAYPDAMARQKAAVTQRRSGSTPDLLILTEHPPVYTVGARLGASAHLIWNPAELAREGIEVHKTNRGGDITYHGPRQIVGYPIVNLSDARDLHAYLRNLEEVLIRAVAGFGLAADRRDGKTGIWLESRKIAAIGVAVKSWVTYHGFALNVAPNLAHISGIVPCGITDGTVTSMEQELGEAPPMAAVKEALVAAFAEVFEAQQVSA
jgi:lipoate-protein ligase B